jgi:hypothetical protein
MCNTPYIIIPEFSKQCNLKHGIHKHSPNLGLQQIESGKHKEVEENKRMFEEEKQNYIKLYNGKSTEELAGVPENIVFDENNLPISTDGSWLQCGKEFTVYTSKSGSRFHRKYGCSGAEKTTHIFNEANKFGAHGCSKCTDGKIYIIPEWYRKYIEIEKIKDRYDI